MVVVGTAGASGGGDSGASTSMVLGPACRGMWRVIDEYFACEGGGKTKNAFLTATSSLLRKPPPSLLISHKSHSYARCHRQPPKMRSSTARSTYPCKLSRPRLLPLPPVVASPAPHPPAPPLLVTLKPTSPPIVVLHHHMRHRLGSIRSYEALCMSWALQSRP